MNKTLPRRLALAATTALLAGTAASQAVIRSHSGPSASSKYGKAVACAGDVDMDGYDDVIIGAPIYLSGTGLMQVRSGRNGNLLLQRAGDAMFDWLGSAVAGAGDVNGDGHDDVVVGAPNAFPFAVAPGYALVLSGADGAQLHRLSFSTSNDSFGTAVAGPGDTDDDGYDDIAVAMLGRVLLYSGRTGAVLHNIVIAGTDGFAVSLARAGDIDGDGAGDIVVGLPNANAAPPVEGTGSVRILSGRTGAWLFTRNGDSPADRLGAAVSGGFDATGDGVPDFLAGAPGDDNNGATSGSVRLYSGATGNAVFTRDGAGFEQLGTSVALLGDMNGDGRAEIAAGAPQPAVIQPTLPGYVRVYSATGTTLFTVPGDAVGDELGTAVASAGDVDRDGRYDLIAGAPMAGTGDLGLARIYRGNFTVDPGRLEDYGRGCRGADGRLPRMGLAGRPSLGNSYTVSVASGPVSAPGILRVAFGRNNVELGFIGAPTCLLLTQFFVDLTIATDPAGRCAVTLPVAANPSLVGLVLDLQWSLLAIGANPLGIITSDGGEVTIGQG